VIQGCNFVFGICKLKPKKTLFKTDFCLNKLGFYPECIEKNTQKYSGFYLPWACDVDWRRLKIFLLLPEYSSTSVCWRLRAGNEVNVTIGEQCKNRAAGAERIG